MIATLDNIERLPLPVAQVTPTKREGSRQRYSESTSDSDPPSDNDSSSDWSPPDADDGLISGPNRDVPPDSSTEQESDPEEAPLGSDAGQSPASQTLADGGDEIQETSPSDSNVMADNESNESDLFETAPGIFYKAAPSSKKYDTVNACLFCHKLIKQKMRRHLKLKHSEEVKVGGSDGWNDGTTKQEVSAAHKQW